MILRIPYKEPTRAGTSASASRCSDSSRSAWITTGPVRPVSHKPLKMWVTFCPTCCKLKVDEPNAKIDRVRPAFGKTASIRGTPRVNVLVHELYRLCALPTYKYSIGGGFMSVACKIFARLSGAAHAAGRQWEVARLRAKQSPLRTWTCNRKVEVTITCMYPELVEDCVFLPQMVVCTKRGGVQKFQGGLFCIKLSGKYCNSSIFLRTGLTHCRLSRFFLLKNFTG